MKKKIRLEFWELVYSAFLIIMLGFWIGCIVGGSSPRFTNPETRENLIIELATIIILMTTLYVFIKVIINLKRKLDIQKRKKVG
jgi:low affinity Fe/Cu permease